MATHSLHLAATPFKTIVSGKKVIESRLYDEKRRQIELGDILVFTNRESSEQTVEVRVVGLLRYKTFREMFARNDPHKFGGQSAEWLEQQVGEFYSLEDQERAGVLGIEFEMIVK